MSNKIKTVTKSPKHAGKNKQGTRNIRFFTICARNFLPSALILAQSVQKAYPGAIFTVYLCDRNMGYDPDSLPVDVAPLESLGIPQLEDMVRAYNITELCTAIKPYCFLREFGLLGPNKKSKPPHVIYLDPDIELFSPLQEVHDAFNDGAQCVLTPHILAPAENVESHDQQFLQMGIYNLGFVALRNSPEVHKVVRWWGRRMVSQCTIDLASGLFVDQKWVDLLPAFLSNVKILRHPGYNIAYWNLHERRIDLSSDALTCNGLPLRFVHYSGIILSDEEERLSRHSGVYYLSNSFGYGDLVSHYRKRLNAEENKTLRRLTYGFLWNGRGGNNLHTPADEIGTGWRSSNTFLLGKQFFSLEQLRDYTAAEVADFQHQRQVERSLIPAELDPDGGFRFPGYCYLCGTHHRMVTSFMYSTGSYSNGDPIPNWREHVACENCQISNRVRASAHIFLQDFLPAPDCRIYITEKKTVLYDWLSLRFSKLQGSEYFGDEYAPGESVDGIRNENMENLSFSSDMFEYVLSFDVLEHVAYPEKAFSEAYRVLQPGGYLIFSVPANLEQYENITRAELNPDGTITHHMEPEFHGNPVDHEGGALCFRYYGWQVMDQLRAVGFSRPHVLQYWSREFGYLGADQVLFIAQKPDW